MTKDSSVRPPKKLWLRIMIPLLTGILVIFIAEFIMMVSGYDPWMKNAQRRKFYLRESAERSLVYELNPRFEGKVHGIKIRINSLGFRGREFGPKKTGTFRIAVLGDSISYAKNLEEEDIYTGRLERSLNRDRSGYEVMNMGVPGYDTLQEVLNFKKNGLPFSPDLVIVQYCLNDIGITPMDWTYTRLFMKTEKSFLDHFRVGSWLNLRIRKLKHIGTYKHLLQRPGSFDGFYGNLYPPAETDADIKENTRAIKELQDRYGQAASGSSLAVLDKPGSLWLNQYKSLKNIGKIRYAFGTLGALARENKFSVIIAIVPFLYKVDGAYVDYPAHNIIRHEAELAGFEVMDLYDEFHRFGFEKINEDGVHLNKIGHELLARILFERITQTSPKSAE